MLKIKAVFVLLTVAILLTVPAISSAQPQICDFYGTVIIDCRPVPDDTVISLKIDGAEVAAVATIESEYSIRAFGDYNGMTVVFSLEDGEGEQVMLGEVQWNQGQHVRKDIDVVLPRWDIAALPVIECVPEEGVITVISGTGFIPERRIDISWDGEFITSAFTVKNGSFQHFGISPDNDPGEYTISAVSECGRSAETKFALTEVYAAGITGPEGEPGPQGEMGTVGGVGPKGPQGNTPDQAIEITALIAGIVAIILVVIFGVRQSEPEV